MRHETACSSPRVDVTRLARLMKAGPRQGRLALVGCSKAMISREGWFNGASGYRLRQDSVLDLPRLGYCSPRPLSLARLLPRSH